MADSEVVGQLGTVVTRIRGSGGPGEVRIRVRGTAEVVIAYADAVIERGADVLVVTSRGARAVDVIAWDC